MNSVVLIGRLTRDVELSYTSNTQTAVARFTLAVNRPRRNGEDQGADFIRIVVWGKQGERCGQYLHKGRQVAVSGRIETGSYKNRDGATVYTTDVIADNVEFLGGGQGSSGDSGQDGFSGGGYGNTRQNQNYRNDTGPSFDDLPDAFVAATDDDDDIPF